ncbi:MAG: hypothetical protein ABID38_05235 [Candidatus Diapherotrites archaeon]
MKLRVLVVVLVLLILSLSAYSQEINHSTDPGAVMTCNPVGVGNCYNVNDDDEGTFVRAGCNSMGGISCVFGYTINIDFPAPVSQITKLEIVNSANTGAGGANVVFMVDTGSGLVNAGSVLISSGFPGYDSGLQTMSVEGSWNNVETVAIQVNGSAVYAPSLMTAVLFHYTYELRAIEGGGGSGCPIDEKIFRINSTTNAHGAEYDQNPVTYPEEICVPDSLLPANGGIFDSSLGHDCLAGAGNVVKLFGTSPITNAHGEQLENSTAGYSDVCLGNLVCRTIDNTVENCIPSVEECVVKLSALTNAHFETCTETNYDYTVCCGAGGGAVPVCGDGAIDAPETCEMDSDCPVGESCIDPTLTNECTCVAPGVPVCGNDTVEGNEECDVGNDLVGDDSVCPGFCNWVSCECLPNGNSCAPMTILAMPDPGGSFQVELDYSGLPGTPDIVRANHCTASGMRDIPVDSCIGAGAGTCTFTCNALEPAGSSYSLNVASILHTISGQFASSCPNATVTVNSVPGGTGEILGLRIYGDKTNTDNVVNKERDTSATMETEVDAILLGTCNSLIFDISDMGGAVSFFAGPMGLDGSFCTAGLNQTEILSLDPGIYTLTVDLPSDPAINRSVFFTVTEKTETAVPEIPIFFTLIVVGIVLGIIVINQKNFTEAKK